jgi:hypothetical protein
MKTRLRADSTSILPVKAAFSNEKKYLLRATMVGRRLSYEKFDSTHKTSAS